MIFYLTIECQRAIIALIKRAIGRKSEYGLDLWRSGTSEIAPGKWARGYPALAPLPHPWAIGQFHTHVPMEIHKILIAPSEYELSPGDILNTLIFPNYMMTGLAVPPISKVPDWELEKWRVKFVTRAKEFPPPLLEAARLILPGAIRRFVEQRIKGYYTIYDFNLDTTRRIPLEIFGPV